MRALLSAALLASAVPEGLSFRPWGTEREVRVEIAPATEGAPWIRGTAELPASAQKVVRVVTDFDRYGEIFAPAVKRVEVLERGDAGARLHMAWPYPFPYRDRDAIVLYRFEELPGGGSLLSWRHDHRPGDPKAGVRITRVAGETKIEPLGREGSRVTYTFLGDLGGRFPRSAEEKAHRAEPVGYIGALRRALGIPAPPK